MTFALEKSKIEQWLIIQLIFSSSKEISRLGNGNGSDLCLEIFANHTATPLFRVEWGHPTLCQVPSFY